MEKTIPTGKIMSRIRFWNQSIPVEKYSQNNLRVQKQRKSLKEAKLEFFKITMNFFLAKLKKNMFRLKLTSQ